MGRVGARVLPAAPVHRELETRGFHNDAWGMSVPPTPMYAPAAPGFQSPCPPPPPLGYPVEPAPGLPPTPPPALPAPATPPPALPAPSLLGPIARPIVEAPQSEPCLEAL